jgi:hypothetical protein
MNLLPTMSIAVKVTLILGSILGIVKSDNAGSYLIGTGIYDM